VRERKGNDGCASASLGCHWLVVLVLESYRVCTFVETRSIGTNFLEREHLVTRSEQSRVKSPSFLRRTNTKHGGFRREYLVQSRTCLAQALSLSVCVSHLFLFSCFAKTILRICFFQHCRYLLFSRDNKMDVFQDCCCDMGSCELMTSVCGGWPKQMQMWMLSITGATLLSSCGGMYLTL
jgi:hypothetical protein